MKIAALHFYNFKGFKGLHKIGGLDKDLSDDQNIVLIGAFNGAGKTSFLETLFLFSTGTPLPNYIHRAARSNSFS